LASEKPVQGRPSNPSDRAIDQDTTAPQQCVLVLGMHRSGTRALTRVLRSAGVMRGVIATGRISGDELVDKARAIPQMEGADLVRGVTCLEPFDWTEPAQAEYTRPG